MQQIIHTTFSSKKNHFLCARNGERLRLNFELHVKNPRRILQQERLRIEGDQFAEALHRAGRQFR